MQLFFGGNPNFSEIKKVNKVCSNAWTSTKMRNTLKLFIDFKMAYACCFSYGENLDSQKFLQNFYNIDFWAS